MIKMDDIEVNNKIMNDELINDKQIDEEIRELYENIMYRTLVCEDSLSSKSLTTHTQTLNNYNYIYINIPINELLYCLSGKIDAKHCSKIYYKIEHDFGLDIKCNYGDNKIFNNVKNKNINFYLKIDLHEIKKHGDKIDDILNFANKYNIKKIIFTMNSQSSWYNDINVHKTISQYLPSCIKQLEDQSIFNSNTKYKNYPNSITSLELKADVINIQHIKVPCNTIVVCIVNDFHGNGKILKIKSRVLMISSQFIGEDIEIKNRNGYQKKI
jgi:hypothetical protein